MDQGRIRGSPPNPCSPSVLGRGPEPQMAPECNFDLTLMYECGKHCKVLRQVKLERRHISASPSKSVDHPLGQVGNEVLSRSVISHLVQLEEASWREDRINDTCVNSNLLTEQQLECK